MRAAIPPWIARSLALLPARPMAGGVRGVIRFEGPVPPVRALPVNEDR
jgi:hypothetical protein